jgi:hypothetical protein
MTFEKAKQEFEVRYYLLATSEFEQEIDRSFPNLRTFKTGSALRLYHFIQQLEKGDQLILPHSLLKRAHPKAVEILGENCSVEEEELRSQRREFNLSEIVTEVCATKLIGENNKFANKRKIRKSILNHFKEAFGSKCIELECVGLDPELKFRMKCCGWILTTLFDFGGSKRQIHYGHTITSETTTKPHGIPKMIMGRGISFNAWLGISGQTQWSYLMDEDIEPACDAAMKFCGHFFEIAPKLLKGLEFEKITEK